MQRTIKPETAFIQIALKKELRRLKRIIPCDGILAVVWKPSVKGKLSGEVLGDTIYVYDESLQEALATLYHEYIDCILTQKIIKPLVAIVNLFIENKAHEIYQEKERIVTGILRLAKSELESKS